MLSLPLLHPILFVHENTVHACDFHLSWYWAVGGARYTEYSIAVAVSHIICIDTIYSHISHLTYHPSINPFLHRTPRVGLISVCVGGFPCFPPVFWGKLNDMASLSKVIIYPASSSVQFPDQILSTSLFHHITVTLRTCSLRLFRSKEPTYWHGASR